MRENALHAIDKSNFAPPPRSASTAFRIASVAALGGLLFGYDSAVVNGAVAAIESRFQVAPTLLGFVVASALLGAALGSMLAGRIADQYSRLTTMRAAAIMFTLSAVGTGFAANIEVLVFFRIVGGIGVGLASVIGPAYISEISPAQIRGRLGSLQQLAIVSGIFISLLTDYAIADLAGGSQESWLGLEAWRWMFLTMCVPAVAYFMLTLTIPESPRHLIAKGHIDEAKRILSNLLGNDGLDLKVEQIQATLTNERRASFRDLKGPTFGLMPIVWIGIGLSVFQQFVGINVIFYYSSVLWQTVGFTEDKSLLITVISSAINIVTTFIAISCIDRVGRRPLLIVGSVGMCVTLATLAFIFGTASVVTIDGSAMPQLTGMQGVVALIAANLFVVAFGFSWGPVVWVLLGEAFPNRIRAVGLSVAAGAQWVANWLITVSFPVLKDFSLGISYGFYAMCAFLSLLFVLRWVKETKGMELEDAGPKWITP